MTGDCRRCGHHDTAHDHYRPGRDCALCACPRYRGPTLLERVMRWLSA